MSTPETIAAEDPRLGLVSASKFSLIVECPGQEQLYRQLEAKLGRDALQSSDEFTEFGNAVHLARQTGNADNLSQEQNEAYERGLEFEKQLVAQWAADNGIKDYAEGPREQRLFLHHTETLDPICSAQLDTQFLAVPHAVVIDWKALYAYRTPPAQRNWQGMVQVTCLFHEIDGLEKIRFALNRCQARRGATDYVDFHRSDIAYAEQAIHYHIWFSKQPGAPRRAGDHCYHCPCRPYCDEAGAMTLLPSVIARRALPTSVDVEEMVEVMTHDDLLKVWDLSGVVNKIIDAVDARLKKLPKEELDRLGLELPAEGKVRQTVKDVKGAFAFLRDTQGLPEEKLWQALGMTKGKVSEILQSERNLAKRWADKNAAEILKDFSEITHDAPSLRRIKGI